MGPGPKAAFSDAARIADLESQLKRIKESGEISPGDLSNQINGMSMLMLDVARVLKMPGDKHLRDLSAHAQAVMAMLTPERHTQLDKALAERGA